MKIFLHFLVSASMSLLLSCNSDSANEHAKKMEEPPIVSTNPPLANTPSVNNIKVSVVKYEALFKQWEKTNDTLIIVNYWATWCKPCVQELPHFFKLYNTIKGQEKVKLILVSLDTKDNLGTSVIPFLQQNGYDAIHFLLDDNGRMNEWIPKVYKSWEGEIPATGFYKNGKLLEFVPGALSEQTLETNIQKYLKS